MECMEGTMEEYSGRRFSVVTVHAENPCHQEGYAPIELLMNLVTKYRITIE